MSMRRLVCSSTIQYIIINLHTKYDYSSLHSFTEIFDVTKNFIIQNMDGKKIGQIQGRIKRRRLIRNATIQYINIKLHIKYDYSSLHSFTEIFDEQFHQRKYGKKDVEPMRSQKGKSRKCMKSKEILYMLYKAKVNAKELHKAQDPRRFRRRNFIVETVEFDTKKKTKEKKMTSLWEIIP